jgi:hypothetical protein
VSISQVHEQLDLLGIDNRKGLKEHCQSVSVQGFRVATGSRCRTGENVVYFVISSSVFQLKHTVLDRVDGVGRC